MVTTMRLVILIFAYIVRAGAPTPDVYDVWAEPNLHIMMSDNGTPGDYDDDWVVDWEDNREIEVCVID